MSIITIIGAGMMGTAIGYPAAGNVWWARRWTTPLSTTPLPPARI